MPTEIYNLLRQFGKDAAGAITAGPEARLKVEQFKEDRALRQSESVRRKAKEQEESQKKVHRARAGELLEEGKIDTPEFQKEAYLSGESLSGLAQLRKAGKKPPGNTPDRYGDEFKASVAFANQANMELGSMATEIADKQASGEDTTQDMQTFTDRYEATKKGLERYVVDFEAKILPTYTIKVSELKDSLLKKYDPARLDVMTETMKKAMTRFGGETQRVMDSLEDNRNHYNVGIDLGGIPSTSDLQKMIWAARAKGDISEEMAVNILNIKSPKKLKEIIEDEKTPKRVKEISAAMLKIQTVSDLVQRSQQKPPSVKQPRGGIF